MPAALSSPCPRSRPASGVRCPMCACPSDRCPVRTSERPGVQCPASGVQCPCAPVSAVSDGNEVVGRGGGAGSRTVGMAGAAWSPAVSTTARPLPKVGAWCSKLAQAVLGQRRAGLE
jgi:hypothetical protein